MIEGILALGAVSVYAYYKTNSKKKETRRFTEFIERVTFEKVPFVKKEELGYTVYFYREAKFSMELWEKDGHFRLFVRDDEIQKPIFQIEKSENGLNIKHPTIFYYRSAFEEKRGLFQAFIHRYVKGDYETVSSDDVKPSEVAKEEDILHLPKAVQEKVQTIQTIYGGIIEKKEQLDIESYTLIETLIFHDLKQILETYGELSEESQKECEDEVLEGLGDILAHLHKIEEAFKNEKMRELKKSLRIVKKRGDY